MAGGERSKATLVAAAAEKQVEKKEAMAAAEKKESLVYSLFGLGLWCQECEELGRKVAELTTENNALRAELDNLKKAVQDMEAENSRLVGGMVHSQGPSVTTTLGMSIEAPKSQQHDDEGQLHKNTNNNSNGNYVGGSHKQEANTR